MCSYLLLVQVWYPVLLAETNPGEGSLSGIKRDAKGCQEAHRKQCWELGMGLYLLNLYIQSQALGKQGFKGKL